MGTTRTSNGSDSDTQTQINNSANGDIVVIPNGTWTWSNGINSNGKSVKIMGQTAGSCNVVNNINNGTIVNLQPVNTPLEFCNINFTCTSAVTGRGGHFIYIGYNPGAAPFAIHDCHFDSNNQLNSQILCAQNGGVIYNCRFDAHSVINTGNGQQSSGDECIQFKHPTNDRWFTDATMGLAGDPNGTSNTYVEDCQFYNQYTETLDFDDGSRTCVRFCVFNYAACCTHGRDTSPFGNRHWELYNNHFIADVRNQQNYNFANGWFAPRGGTGVFTANSICPIDNNYWGNHITIKIIADGVTQSNAGRYYTAYPAPRVVGQGWKSGTISTTTAGPFSIPGSGGSVQFNVNNASGFSNLIGTNIYIFDGSAITSGSGSGGDKVPNAILAKLTAVSGNLLTIQSNGYFGEPLGGTMTSGAQVASTYQYPQAAANSTTCGTESNTIGGALNGVLGYCQDPFYYWNNSPDNQFMAGNIDTFGWSDFSDTGTGVGASSVIKQGIDFFFNQGAKPGWSPYTYPHPLRAQLAGGGGGGGTITDSDAIGSSGRAAGTARLIRGATANLR